jgi:hypothetical protein
MLKMRENADRAKITVEEADIFFIKSASVLCDVLFWWALGNYSIGTRNSNTVFNDKSASFATGLRKSVCSSEAKAILKNGIVILHRNC